MTYKELLKQYKENKLDKADRLQIEQDLEKYQAINDYLAEEIDCQFSGSGPTADPIQQNSIHSKIQTAMNRRLIRLITIFFLLIFLLIRCVLDPFVSGRWYNPTKKSAGQSNTIDLLYDLGAVTEVSMPGLDLDRSVYAETLGFAKYQIHCSYRDLFQHQVTLINTKLDRNFPLGDMSDLSYPGYYSFTDFLSSPSQPDAYQEELESLKQSTQEQIDHIRALPSTSYLSVCVRFTENLPLNAVLEQIRNNNLAKYEWLAIQTADIQRSLMGLSLDRDHLFHLSDSISSTRYPNFQLSDTSLCTASNLSLLLETHFRSMLTYLSDRQEAVDALFEHSYDYSSALHYVEDHGIAAYGALIYGEPEAILKLYDSGVLSSLTINSVLASKYSW